MNISEDSFLELDSDYSIDSYDSFSSYESVDSSTSTEYIDEIEDEELKFDDLEKEIYIELLKQNYIQEYKNMFEENEKYIKFMNDKCYNNILNYLFTRRKNKLIQSYTDLISKYC